jgi:xylan 1,4-beta-xylosidase
VPSPRQSGPAAGPGASAAPAEESAPRQNEPAAVAGASAAPAEESAPRQSEPAAGPHPNPAGTVDGVFHDDFDDLTLNVHWQSPRIRLDTSHFSLSQRPGYLRLHGGESPSSRFNVSMIARRQQSFRCRATTSLDFFPESYKQLAGLICYYNDLAYHYLYVTTDDDGANRRIGILSRADGKEEFPIRGDEPILPREGALILRADIDHNELRFSFSSDGQDRQVVGADLDATILSDEFGSGWGFTGSFIGVTCQDLAGLRRDADFAWFRYEEL